MYTSKLLLQSLKCPYLNSRRKLGKFSILSARNYSKTLDFGKLVEKHINKNITVPFPKRLASDEELLEEYEDIWNIDDQGLKDIEVELEEDLYGEDLGEYFGEEYDFITRDPLLERGKKLFEEIRGRDVADKLIEHNPKLAERMFIAQYLEQNDLLENPEDVPKDLPYFLGYKDDYMDQPHVFRLRDKNYQSSFHRVSKTIYDEEIQTSQDELDTLEVRDSWEPQAEVVDLKPYHHDYLLNMHQHVNIVNLHEKLERVDELKYKKILSELGKEEDTDYSSQFVNEAKEMEEDFKIARYGSVIGVFSTIQDKAMSPVLWEYYLQSLEYVGRIKEVITQVKYMWKKKIKFTPIIYTKVIKAYIALRLHDRINLWLDRMKRDNIYGTIELYNALLLKQLRELPIDFEKVEMILNTIKKANLKPNGDTLDLLLLCYASTNRYDEVMPLIEKYNAEYETRNGRITYSIMAESFLYEGNLEGAQVYLKKLERMRVPPRTKTYNLIIQTYLNRGDKAKAEMTYNDLRTSGQKANLDTYKIFLRYFRDTHDVNGIKFVFSRMGSEKLCPDKEILQIALDGFYRVKNMEEYNKYFKELLIRQMRPDREYYTMKIELMEDGSLSAYGNMINEIEYMKQSGIEPTKDEIRIILNSIYNTGNPELFSSFVNDYLVKYNITLDLYDYLKISRIWMDYELFELAEQRLNEIESNKIPITDAEYFVLRVELASRKGDINKAIESIEALKKEIKNKSKIEYDSVHFQTILSCLMTVSPPVDEKVIDDLYQFMRQNTRNVINIDIFDLLISLSKNYGLSSTMKYYKDMQTDFRIIPTKSIYSSVLDSISAEISSTKNPKLLETGWEVMTDALANPSLSFIPLDILNQILEILIKYGSVDVYSYSLAWYKKVSNYDQPHLDDVTSVLFRNWFSKTKKESVIPPQYIERDLNELSSKLGTKRF